MATGLALFGAGLAAGFAAIGTGIGNGLVISYYNVYRCWFDRSRSYYRRCYFIHVVEQVILFYQYVFRYCQIRRCQ